MTWAARLRRRQESITKYSSDHRPTVQPQTTDDTQLNTASTTNTNALEGTTTMTNNREIALQHAVDNAATGASHESIQAAAEVYLAFLEGTSTATAAAPAPAPRTGAEILQVIRSKTNTYGRVVTADLLRRADVLRHQPLDSAVRTALGALQGANEYPTGVVVDLSAALRRLTSGSAPLTTPATGAQGGERVVGLLRRYEGQYGGYITELLAEAARRGFAQLSLVEAKRLAVQVLADNYEYRFPNEARTLIREVNAL